MNKKTVKYTDMPLGNAKIVEDFLPAPKDLVFKDEPVKITLSLSKSSVNFFKMSAKKHHTQYQKMIRSVLDHYVERFQ